MTPFDELPAALARRDPHEAEFRQAAGEVLESIRPWLEANPLYRRHALIERLLEPERVIQFRVAWVDDAGATHVNRAWRVQHSSAIGPYKGGMRFHPSVNLSVLKFLAFEQTFKNALTRLPLGGAKGGADFDPKGRSDAEVMRFCQALAAELHRHLGPDTDVPAGDIGVGAREVGYMAGMAKKLANSAACAFTGKPPSTGGSQLRTEAAGLGLVHFVRAMLQRQKAALGGQRVAISGAGNVAQHAAREAARLGATVISLSDSGGTVWHADGLSTAMLSALVAAEPHGRVRMEAFARQFGLQYLPGARPWQLPCDVALPCATQNELDETDARALAAHGVRCVAEGANMPCTPGAASVFRDAGIAFGPGKAANAGGVIVSAFEMSQNAMHIAWPREELERRLAGAMHDIHEACVAHGERDGRVDYVRGANVAAFIRVADAMLAQGVT